MSQTTKRALAASLEKLLAKKPLDKITVIDIVEDCEVNRQTFYYHFRDIYDLLEWTLLNETSKALGGKKTYATWQEGFLNIFEWVQKNKAMVSNIYHSVSREHIERHLYEITYDLLIGVVEEQAQDLSVRAEDKKFIADFYKFAFVGIMLEWIRTGMTADPKDIVSRMSMLLHGDVRRALLKYSPVSDGTET